MNASLNIVIWDMELTLVCMAVASCWMEMHVELKLSYRNQCTYLLFRLITEINVLDETSYSSKTETVHDFESSNEVYR